jgi:uncharacterized protein
MMKPSRILIGLFLFLIISTVEAMACPLELPTATITVNGHSLIVELAATPAARTCGLSHREDLPQNRGMLFIFPSPGPETFWMKDTLIPLSIAFVDNAGQIMNIQDMIPMQTEELYSSQGPARYAIEVNQGWFERQGIAAGDQVVMQLPLVLDIK